MRSALTTKPTATTYNNNKSNNKTRENRAQTHQMLATLTQNAMPLNFNWHILIMNRQRRAATETTKNSNNYNNNNSSDTCKHNYNRRQTQQHRQTTRVIARKYYVFAE